MLLIPFVRLLSLEVLTRHDCGPFWAHSKKTQTGVVKCGRMSWKVKFTYSEFFLIVLRCRIDKLHSDFNFEKNSQMQNETRLIINFFFQIQFPVKFTGLRAKHPYIFRLMKHVNWFSSWIRLMTRDSLLRESRMYNTIGWFMGRDFRGRKRFSHFWGIYYAKMLKYVD